jgi:hypothetical protein
LNTTKAEKPMKMYRLPIRIVLLLIAALPLMATAWMGRETPCEHCVIEGEIRWKAGSRLTWDDFQGRPDRLSPMDALTESGITYSWSCDWRGFQLEAYSLFVPEGSWVKEPTNDLLIHEQGHFDITEIHARKLRKFFAEHPDPCRLGKTGIDNAAKTFITTNYEVQNQYDEATNHGENTRVQKEWVAKIAAELKTLDEWAD